MKPPLTQFLAYPCRSCQNPNSNTVGRYVHSVDAIHDGHPCSDTDEGIVYVVPVGPFYHAFTDALTGKELPDSSSALVANGAIWRVILSQNSPRDWLSQQDFFTLCVWKTFFSLFLVTPPHGCLQ